MKNLVLRVGHSGERHDSTLHEGVQKVVLAILSFNPRAADFRRLNVSVIEYALPSSLPSGRETFHAKVVLADDSEFYVGSSNFMGSALDRSFECGVFVRGETAKQMRSVLIAVQSVGKPVRNY